MPNTIYSSEKVMPYVYMGVHKETGQFYFGFRGANKYPSTEDLGTKYFTSSKKVKELGFHNFNWTILAEFFEQEDAFIFEQNLIFNNFKDDLILNRFMNNKFSMIGKKHSEETKKKQSIARKNVVISEETRRKRSYLNSQRKGKVSDETKQKISIGNTGKIKTPETIEKMRQSNLGVKRSEETKQKFKLVWIGRKLAGELMDQIDAAIDDKVTDRDSIQMLKDRIKRLRQSGLEKGSEYSVENLAWKTVRNNGYLDKLDEYVKNLDDASLSVED